MATPRARTVGIGRGLIEEIRDMCTDKGWRENLPLEPRKTIAPYSQYVLGAYLMLLVSEASEALEAQRDGVWSDTCMPRVSMSTDRLDHHPGCSGKPHAEPKPIGVGPELADVLIRAVDIADIWGIDLNHEISRVLEYGWTREYQHGGRAL